MDAKTTKDGTELATAVNKLNLTTTTTPESTAYDRWKFLDDSTIDYGCFSGRNAIHKKTPSSSSSSGTTTTSDDKETFYITTAINYANGPAHLGHAYEAATADAIARYHRLRLGDRTTSNNNTTETTKRVLFVTGADEHGQKIANTAQTESVTPMELCDRYVNGFRVLNQRLLVGYDDYVRTTSERHKATARALWLRCASATSPVTTEHITGTTTTTTTEDLPDIYLSNYSGWYNVREELFVTETDAQATDFKDPVSNLPLKKVEEESYFFRMSAYHDRLLDHIHTHPEFIRPTWQRNQIIARLKEDKLRDLSISRTTFDWGISVPPVPSDATTTEAAHVMYVWFDALTNYLTAVDGLHLENSPDRTKRHFWPAGVHIIGKDISWFHTVIWPTILMSAGLPLPRTVFAHGFVNDADGRKMSKSIGNVVDPHDMLDRYRVDAFRYYLCREAPYGGELSFSEESLVSRHDADLCDTLGNLVHRATHLCGKHCGGVVPDVGRDTAETKVQRLDWVGVRDGFMAKMNAFELEGGAALAMKGLRDVNGYLTEREPWHKKGPEFVEERQVIVRETLEAVYALTLLLIPFIPVGASEVFRKLGTEPRGLMEVDPGLRNLETGAKVTVGKVLYTKIGEEEKSKSGGGGGKAGGKKAMSYEEAKELKRREKAKANEASKAGQKKSGGNKKGAEADVNQPEFTKMDIRVGLVTKVWNHPDADKLLCEEIDVGEDNGGIRQITSGLRGHYTVEEMTEKKVLVVCNLKASKIVGFSSNGMVLAAKSEDKTKIELITPPSNSTIGERVFIEGLEGTPFSPAQVKKKKTWDAVAKELKTGDGGVAMWSGKELRTKDGVCGAATLEGVPFS